jgi:hypothetical protein
MRQWASIVGSDYDTRSISREIARRFPGRARQLSLLQNVRTGSRVHPASYLLGKGKGTVHPRTGHEGPEEELRYSSTPLLSSALDEGGWSTPRPGRFTPRKDPVPIV